jgi:hypothetical protein
MRLIALTTACLLTACQAAGIPGFDTTASQGLSYAPPGTNLQSVTLNGNLLTTSTAHKNLTIAAVSAKRTVAAAPVTNGAFSLSLPEQTEFEDDKAFAVHTRWEIVLFSDKNANGTYDNDMPPAKASERDVPIPTIESFKLAYKGYVSTPQTYIFLPRNDFQLGWILVTRTGNQPSQYHQDFSRKYNLTDSTYRMNNL